MNIVLEMNATEDAGRLSREITKSRYGIDSFMTHLRIPNVQGPLAGRMSVDGVGPIGTRNLENGGRRNAHQEGNSTPGDLNDS